MLIQVGVTVNACHPGVIDTSLLKGLGFGSSKSPAEGADTAIWYEFNGRF